MYEFFFKEVVIIDIILRIYLGYNKIVFIENYRFFLDDVDLNFKIVIVFLFLEYSFWVRNFGFSSI